MKNQRRLQMPPLLNALGGAGKFIQAVALEKVKADSAIKLSAAKELRKRKKNQKVIEVGTESFTFNTGENLAGTGNERANAGIIDIFDNMSPDAFKRAMKTGSQDQKQNLFSFLTMRHLDWNNNNEDKRAEDGQIAPTTHAYKDIYSVYKNRLVPYGLAYARKIVNPSYSNAISDWVARHPELKGTFVIDKVNKPEAIKYDFAPSSLTGSEYINDVAKIAKKLNISPKEAIRMFKVKGVDGSELEANDEAHLLPYKLYRKLQNNVGIVSDAKQFTGERDLLDIRREAIQGGMSVGQYINLLQTISPDMAAKSSPSYIFVDKAKRRQASNKYMKEYFGIDTLARGQAAGGALQAGITATNMKNTILQVGAGGNKIAARTAKIIEAFQSNTGPLAGVQQVFKNFFEDISFRSGGVENNASNRFLKARYQNAQNLMNASNNLLGRPLEIGGKKYKNAEIAKFAGYVEFMKFQLAYQMASALQGGTGGRTISDQDVENMLRSMNFDGLSSVEHIAASLERISNIMGELHLVNSFYSDSPQKAHAALLYEKTNLMGGSAYADYVAKKVSQATKVGNPNYRPVSKRPIFDDQGNLTYSN